MSGWLFRYFTPSGEVENKEYDMDNDTAMNHYEAMARRVSLYREGRDSGPVRVIAQSAGGRILFDTDRTVPR